MANAAPYIARPIRRVVAGALDLWACLFVVFWVFGVTTSVSYSSSYIEVILLNKMAFVAYAAYHAICFWAFRGTTPGLYFLDIRVVSASNGAELSFVQILARAGFRPIFLYSFWWTAGLAASLPGADTILLVAPVLAELGMMFTLPTRQTLSDLVSRTLVVNIPPPQPHRAPAAPMYSPSDAEFGIRSGKTK
jgi:uncharacterized RDD family membrane protein YckC